MHTLVPENETPRLNQDHLSTLKELAKDEAKAFIEDLANTFKRNWEETYPKIQSSCKSKDNKTLGFLIHAMNGSAGNVGLQRLCILCRKIEESIHEGTFNTHAESPASLRNEYEASMKDLDAYVREL